MEAEALVERAQPAWDLFGAYQSTSACLSGGGKANPRHPSSCLHLAHPEVGSRFWAEVGQAPGFSDSF